MAEAPSIPGGESHENGDLNGRDHELFLPIANVIRIIKKGLPADAQIAKDAKEAIQDCVSVFVSFITSEANDSCREDKRQTLNGDDVLYAMKTLGFEDYVGPLKAYLKKYRESEGNHVQSIKDHDGSVRKEGVQLQPHQGNSQSQGNYVRSIKDHDGSVRKEVVQLQPHQGNSQSQSQGDYIRSIKDHDGSVKKEEVQLQPHEGKSESQSQGDYVRSIKDHDGSVRKEGVQLQPHEGNSESQSQNTIGKTQGESDVEAVDETKHIMMDLKESGYTAKEIAAALCDDEWIRTLVNFE